MIYCIVAKDRDNGNEWVMPKTAETIVEIGAILDDYRDNDPRFEYRMELISPGVNDIPIAGHPGVYPNVSRRPFTTPELFPPANGITTSDCQECGAYVKIQQQNKHTTWHNKVADL